MTLEDLLAWWTGELTEELADEVEERLFSDAGVADQVEALRGLDAGVTALLRGGRVIAGVTVATLGRLQATGVHLRTHTVAAGEVTPCAVALEDVVAVRLTGFTGVTTVDLVQRVESEGQPPRETLWRALPVDQDSGEVVLVYPGDVIRALPRTRISYVARGGETRLEFGLDHTP